MHVLMLLHELLDDAKEQLHQAGMLDTATTNKNKNAMCIPQAMCWRTACILHDFRKLFAASCMLEFRPKFAGCPLPQQTSNTSIVLRPAHYRHSIVRASGEQ